ncbi:MFS transporter [Kosakonia radicincitans DSM 16656]|uniref:Fucose permease n=1 Tax=Kosakonia radicincitans TaxID=283686 RepID=A0AAX2EYJ8_9ENTR|nr:MULTISPECIES: MFS transporter [Kosakonia]MDP9568263.1 MFS family permease [Kosakonia oryzae]APG18686.1 transporter [Kosakonia radicincitans]ARD60222.1 MFS transporter [Kosakonia radicincitans DSM 16656]KDE33352.1 transporter [Kosakonia radicincitans UMEnt01/12]MDD7993591.1 MFS transporter [Kosakonia radicincitans]
MSQNKAFSTPFILAVICIYLSYFLHGISVITLAQNMTSLAAKFSTNNAGIAYLISGIGLGRLVSILFFGVISDKFGRRAVILLGVVLYMLFFFGIPSSPNLMVAFVLAVCVGVANSALDTGGYPALMECFPTASGSAVILVKAMVSFGQMLYPMIVSYMLLNDIWYGYSVIIPGVLFVLITLMLLKSRFPGQQVDASVAKALPQMNSKPLPWLEGIASVLFGVAAFSTFYVIVVWMPKYAMAFAGMAEADALKTISYYSMGSLLCVFIFAALLKTKVRPVWANVFNAGLAAITAAVIYLFPSPLVCNAGAFVIGFSAAGGILQLGVSVMSEFFPKSKAKVTSVYMMMGGLANFIIPLITGYLSNIGLQYIILLDFFFALLAFLTAAIVFVRYYRVFNIPKNDVRFGERYFQKTASVHDKYSRSL